MSPELPQPPEGFQWYNFDNAIVTGTTTCGCLQKHGNITSVLIDGNPNNDDRGAEASCPHGNSFLVVPAHGNAPFVDTPAERNRIWINI